MAGRVLYLTFDGVLQPLGYSQVVRLLLRLARDGFEYRLLSLERPEHLADRKRVEDLERELGAAGICWLPVSSEPMRATGRAAKTVARVLTHASRLMRREDIALVHARGYQSAGVAFALKRTFRVPYLFDARGYWIEERAAPGEWFGGAASYAAGKFVEQTLFRGAAAVVTLTELQAIDLREGIFGPERPVIAVPTCADFDAFQIHEARPQRPSDGIPERVQARLAGKLVLGLVGSINRSYDFGRTATLLRAIVARRRDAHVLVFSSQEQQYRRILLDAGIPESCFTTESVPHHQMPTWVHWMDWAPLLLARSAAKRGSMPTKLAEFFASGVRPIHYGCNEEASEWVRRAGSGIVLDGLDDEALTAAAETVCSTPPDRETLVRARARTQPHFALESGSSKYATLLRSLL